MTDSLLTASFIPCGKVKRARDKHDDSFVFVCVDGAYVPFRANSPQLDAFVGEDLYMIDDGERELTMGEVLKGKQVVDTAQGLLGVIASVDESTANTLIELDNGTLLPLHDDFIVSLDDEKLTLTLPFILNYES